jgi:LysM repeat protein
MSTLSISRMVVPLMAIGAAAAATLVFADRYVRPQPSDDHAIVAAAPAPPAAPEPATGGRDQQPGKLAAVQAETDHLAATLNPPKPPETGAEIPEFDVASIQPTGEAVIAGRAAPGATVELLRNGEFHDRTVADQAGLFVMIPHQLPPGNYDLTLRSRQSDGKEAISKQHVAVAVEAAAAQQPIAQSRPNQPSVVPPAPAAPATPAMAAETGKAEHSVAAAQTAPSASTSTSAPRPPRLAAAEAAVLPGLASSSAAIAPKSATTTVARGDSLWRISRRTLGAGTRYSILFRANRDRIRNADLIYPGQVFVLPPR